MTPHDIWQGHLMRFSGILHELSSRNLRDPDNLSAVKTTVKQVNETLDLLTADGHTPADTRSAEAQDGVHLYS